MPFSYNLFAEMTKIADFIEKNKKCFSKIFASKQLCQFEYFYSVPNTY